MAQITLQVNTLLDQNDGSSDNGLSLRDAILIANANRNNQYIIELQSGSTYNLTLNNSNNNTNETASKTGDLNIRTGVNVTIKSTNSNQPAIIDASQLNFKDRVFSVAYNSSLTLNNINITGGNVQNDNNRFGSGAGIYNSGFLVLINSQVTNNVALDSAGIANDAGITWLINSSITDNKASQIGGISNFNDGLFIIYGSTISDNESENFGGGIFNDIGTVHIINSTIARNKNTSNSGSGAIYNYSTGEINSTNVTLINNVSASNTGGIYNAPTGIVKVANSIIANNNLIIAENNIVNSDFKGEIQGNKNNLIGTIQGATGTIGQESDITFAEAGITNLNQVLELQLKNNGGNTLTYALIENSPAINAGNNNNLPTNIIDFEPNDNITATIPYDQRGFKRISGGIIDIGAYEYPFIPTISISDVTIGEGNNGTIDATFTVTLSETDLGTITVDYATANGTALAGNDYTAQSDTLTFAPNETTKTITISITGDTTAESDETFFINLSNATNATILDNQSIAKIINDDAIIGDANNNNLVGYAGNDTIQGLAGNDTLTGDAGDDSLDGGEGNDTLTGGVGNDIFIGGNGTDRVVESGNVNFTLTNTSLTGLGNDTLSSIEQASLTGGTGNNNLNASAFTAGIVILNGGSGNDTLRGGSKNDTLTGGTGNDSLVGGNGTDRVVESGNVDFILTNTSLTGLGNDTLSSIEQASLTGGTGNNNLNASAFTTGIVILNGGNGNDTLTGGSGNDTLNGGNDNDTLTGGNGTDSLTGGSGSDSFQFNSPSQGVDTITDFNVTDDKIRISKTDFNLSFNVGTLPASRFNTGSQANNSSRRFFYDSTNGKLWFDSDGNGATSAIQIATLSTGLALTHQNIIIF